MMPFAPRALLAFLALTAPILASGCGGGDDESASEFVTVPAPEVRWPTLECDPLVPSYCGFPFPSNVFTKEDTTSPTGRRVQLAAATLPVASSGVRSKPDPWNISDGFSPGAALLAELPGAIETGLPNAEAIERSLEADSPTVLLDAETGERVAHFSEIDKSGGEVEPGEPENRALMIRPAVRLEDGRRYIVAIRGVQGRTGPVEPSPAFKALRDKRVFDDASITARRGLYEDIFLRLGSAGVARETLQLAWDFTTASRDNNTARLIHMRDEALALAGDDGPAYTIDVEDTAFDPEHVAVRIEGKLTVPLYLDDPAPGSNLLLGADGLPEPNPKRPTYEIPFELMIPKSAADEPAALLQYGHGLLGERGQIHAQNFRELIQKFNYAIFAVDLVGMSDDSSHIADVLATGDVDRLSTMFDRMHQGTLNYLMAMRTMSRGFAKDPKYGKYINKDERYYHGISQGGIFGGVYMSVSTDVTRGVLEVMGQPYNLLLNRSVDFGVFFTIMRMSFPDTRDQQFYLNLIQMLWDRVEPNGYTKYLRQDMLPNTPAHEVLMRAAVGDHQVTTLGAHIMARAIGAKHIDSGVRPIYGLETVKSATQGSGYIEYEFGLPPAPVCNIPLNACDDPHGELRYLDAAGPELDHFLRTGKFDNFCPNGVCRFPELSGCKPGEQASTCPE
jgi:hypothetical protein